jgi:hypothetical protein
VWATDVVMLVLWALLVVLVIRQGITAGVVRIIAPMMGKRRTPRIL